MLANPKDTYESAEFENREGTDRMVLKFRKAAGKESEAGPSG
jgi:predicted methyltransferase